MFYLKDLAKLINAELIGDYSLNIDSIAPITKAKKTQLAYINNKKYKSNLIDSKAGAIILNKELLEYCPTNALIVDNPNLAFAKISKHFRNKIPQLNGIDKSAKINTTKIGNGCNIGKNVIIGKNCIIGSNSIIEDNVIIGVNSHISSNVTILQNCIIGKNVAISPGVVIGSEGFGKVIDKENHWHNIYHLGKVIIGDNVTIGANTTIDRGTLADTEIHNGVHIDNLVHIAHNVIIEEDCAIAASVGIAGSSKIGKRCKIGGMAGIINHINICDDVTISVKSIVTEDIKKSGIYTGIMPIMPHKRWMYIGAWLRNLSKK
jgi:UDP-3-O-[3-hydroxymyristoyl] glucosamine N-acyltransferase